MQKTFLKTLIRINFLFFALSIMTINQAQAMDDQYTDDQGWARFHSQRAANTGLSEEERWNSAQLAAQYYDSWHEKNGWPDMPAVSPYQIYRTAKIGEVKNPYSVLPPLNSTVNNIGAYYPYSSNSNYRPAERYSIQNKTQHEVNAKEASTVNDNICSCGHIFCGSSTMNSDYERFTCRGKKAYTDGVTPYGQHYRLSGHGDGYKSKCHVCGH